ncbi:MULTISPECIES: prephenate dehydrogenase [unclassified Mucilaginibacter]|uniref:prephenate dehydrogenase n=1 Tax=unclassified Mucilaginibacter TaxID=2617802 RepID=UPI00095E6D81|nr:MULTISPECIES: prephenate dehydrogenase [unclassified Mucilaginibacter]OJW15243.1 MAG: prephenate dehydrogenase [Mucilaginibacter sp. 44-25]PLW90826.1 MAG: prephenate dehydrogenase/arogenate dehydrogenase family protein [Mucilaginibacter sp.]PMP66058.1 MAG: prephenate dehydrogenase/arogenate dehydrogenase family protein [Mucilaginibacter sp.]HEK20624.1 prephenate dehydrogenase [Bacteroidota bacterium]
MQIGMIGLGDMGKLYAKAFAAAGYKVVGCDMPANRQKLEDELNSLGITLMDNGKDVARISDLIIYSVEADKLEQVVAEYGPATKYNAIVAGQTSVKHPEIAVFEKYLPADARIVTFHAMHGAGFEPKGQKLILIPHRTDKTGYEDMLGLFNAVGSDVVEMKDYHEHDQIVADTQAVTHVGFESMGTAWKSAGFFPWENASYVGGIDNVKILTTLRIFSYKAHVYAGLALLNPYAKQQVRQYAMSESELFKLMIKEEATEFRQRLYKARDFVFHESRKPIMLNDAVMREFSLSDNLHKQKPNSHLSILSMVDAWYHLGVNPYDNLICQTPPFRLRLGIAEYLFKNEELLEESIETALYDKTIRGDDLEFHSAVREWSSIIGYGDMEGYKKHFNEVQSFFTGRLEEGNRQSAELIKRLMQA